MTMTLAIPALPRPKANPNSEPNLNPDQAEIAYAIGLCYYQQKQFGPALKHIAEIIERGVREHPELSVGSQTEGIEVRSVRVRVTVTVTVRGSDRGHRGALRGAQRTIGLRLGLGLSLSLSAAPSP